MMSTPTPPPGVQCGKDGWLFLAGGTNDVLNFYTQKKYLSDEAVEKWVSLFRNRVNWFSQAQIPYFHMYAPDKISIYPEFFGQELPHFDQRPNLRIRQALREAGLKAVLADTETAFLEAKDDAAQYWKTDTHWSPDGAMTALRIVCNQFNLPVPFSLADRDSEFVEMYRDLGGKFTPKRAETCRRFKIIKNAKVKHRNIVIETGYRSSREGRGYPGGLLNGGYVVHENTAEGINPQRILVFGDSYCESRHGAGGLTEFLAEAFREVHFCWSNSLDFRMVETIKPDLVFSESAERFVRMVPDDQRDFVKFGEDRVAEYLKTLASPS